MASYRPIMRDYKPVTVKQRPQARWLLWFVAGLGLPLITVALISPQGDTPPPLQSAQTEIMAEATPRGLAAYAQQGKAQEAVVSKLLSSGDLLVQMAVADGASGGNYGRAMEIYRDILKASDKVEKGPLQRLAMAVALEHATPMKQRVTLDNLMKHSVALWELMMLSLLASHSKC